MFADVIVSQVFSCRKFVEPERCKMSHPLTKDAYFKSAGLACQFDSVRAPSSRCSTPKSNMSVGLFIYLTD